jgi:uncharacterized membrane protein
MTEALTEDCGGSQHSAGDASQSNAISMQTTNVLLTLIIAIYALTRLFEVGLHAVPRTDLVALDVFSALAFAVVHGARHYGARGVGVFIAVCLIVGNVVENIGVMTGFPFGRYYFADLMGPKLFNVPILLGCAYIGMAYVSFILARIILGRVDVPRAGARAVALPLAAGFIMVAWDLAQDPVWATVLHGWVWRDGGPWFGVPVSNYFGWYLTVFLIYSEFTICLGPKPIRQVNAGDRSWALVILFYAVCAFGNVLQRIPAPNPAVVADPAGRLWRVTDITGASALVSIFVMGAFAAIAWIRLGEMRRSSRD